MTAEEPANVVPLPGVQAKRAAPNPVLVEMLELMLAKARAGEMQSLVGAGFTQGGTRFNVFVDDPDDIYATLGCLEWLKAEYIHRNRHALR